MEASFKNRKAFHTYKIVEKFEAGLVLKGSEVKSVRSGHAHFTNTYGSLRDGEIFLYNLKIDPYDKAGAFNHDPERPKKLLLRKKQIRYIERQVNEKKLAVVPLSLHFRNGYAKVEIGLCTGKKRWDKRAVLAERSAKRKMDQARKMRKL